MTRIEWTSEVIQRLSGTATGQRALAARNRARAAKPGSPGRRRERRTAERLALVALAELAQRATPRADFDARPADWADAFERIHQLAPSTRAIEVHIAPEEDTRVVTLRGASSEDERAAVERFLTLRGPHIRWRVKIQP